MQDKATQQPTQADVEAAMWQLGELRKVVRQYRNNLPLIAAGKMS